MGDPHVPLWSVLLGSDLSMGQLVLVHFDLVLVAQQYVLPLLLITFCDRHSHTHINVHPLARSYI